MSLGKTIVLVGAGNIAEALVKGFLRSKIASPQEVICTDRRSERGPELTERYGVRFTSDNLAAVREADIVILSVKPQAMNRLLDEISPALDGRKLVISIAAGVPLEAIERKVGHGVRIVRTMPNTPVLVGAGATAISPGVHATTADLAQTKALFDAVGKTVVVDEPLLDAVTGLSGSGPAYIFLIIEALADAGVKVGLDRRIAQELSAQTLLGSAKLLLETGAHPGQLKDQVTSPGGTAIAGLHTLEAGGLRTTLINAVEAATKRAHELGKKFLEAKEDD
jgi:pyrroline-5-carboxylate reductase